MLEFLDSQYRSSFELAQYQDFIIKKPAINLLEVDKYIQELNKYNILFKSFFGLNQIPENNLGIRQNIILSTLYYLKKDLTKAKDYKVKADNLFLNLRKNSMYQEGWSYLIYVKESYDFHFRYVPNFFAGNIDPSFFAMIEKIYRKFASPDNKLPFTDTAYIHELVNEERVTFHNDLYSVFYLNNTETYVFVDHNKYIYDYCKNLHVNYSFGHFVVFNKGRSLVLHPWYGGYNLKQSSDLKETWNHNIILDGNRTQEPYWRYLPYKPELGWTYKSGVFNFKIGDKISRKIEILNTGIFVSDNGGNCSSFNISNDCQYNYSGKLVEKVGYHCPEYDKIETHKRIEISGNQRLFYIAF